MRNFLLIVKASIYICILCLSICILCLTIRLFLFLINFLCIIGLFFAAVLGKEMLDDNVISDPNALNLAGMTVLNESIHNGNVKDVKKLLDHGADVNQVGKCGKTALRAAIQFGNLLVVQMVLNYGADVNQVNKNGNTALATAVHYGNLAVVQMVLQHGAFVNQVALRAENGSHTGFTLSAFKKSLFIRKLEIANLLLQYGGNVEDKQLDCPMFRSNLAVADLIDAQKKARSAAREGDLTHFYLEIEEGTLHAPLVQWIPVLPPAARAEFSAWVLSSMKDSSACYAAFFRPITTFMHSSATCLLRDQIGHDGISHIRRLVISYLVFHNPKTRKIIHECNAFGSEEVVTPMQITEAISRVTQVRAAWPE
jgi:hypothetical protein